MLHHRFIDTFYYIHFLNILGGSRNVLWIVKWTHIFNFYILLNFLQISLLLIFYCNCYWIIIDEVYISFTLNYLFSFFLWTRKLSYITKEVWRKLDSLALVQCHVRFYWLSYVAVMSSTVIFFWSMIQSRITY